MKVVETNYNYGARKLGYIIEEEKNGYCITFDSQPVILMYKPLIGDGDYEEMAMNHVKYLHSLGLYNIQFFLEENEWHNTMTELMREICIGLCDHFSDTFTPDKLYPYITYLQYVEYVHGTRNLNPTDNIPNVSDEIKNDVITLVYFNDYATKLEEDLGDDYPAVAKETLERVSNNDAIEEEKKALLIQRITESLERFNNKNEEKEE